jgi:branched-chain amino acid transport system permease protein
MGINVRKINAISGVIGISLAAVAGVLTAPLSILTPWMWTSILPTVLAVAILGGLGSLKGSLLAAIVFGFIHAGVSLFYPQFGYLKDAIAFIVVLIVFMVRPEGLFGISLWER